MTTIDPAGYSEAGAHLFTWLADKALGGVKKAFGWGWERAQWAAAQDRYDARIIQDYGQIRIFGQTTPKSLKDIFTDVYVLDTPTAYRRFDPADLAKHLWEEDRGLSFRHEERRPGEELLDKGSKFYILGKPGAGKTTFLKHLAVREAQRGRWGPCLGKIPIFVSLKQFGETSQSLFDFIVDEFAVCGFPNAVAFVQMLLKSGKALVLFDGLDEVSKTEEDDSRGQVTQMLAQFARRYTSCHIVITCRIAAVEYAFDPAFTYMEMADFAPDQVETFVHAWFWDESDKNKGFALAEGMLAQWKRPEHAGLRDLGRNPLLLTLLCLNYAETLSFPARRMDIYEEALDALLKKWDASHRIQRGGLYKTLSLGRKRQMFARIAFDALARSEIVFAQADLERRLVEYLANVPELPEDIDIDGEAVLREIVAQHGIFAEQAHGLFSFAHLTFQEYYAARYIADKAGSGALDTLLSHIADDKWQEVFLLTASMLPDATAFLTSFEGALQRLIVGRPQLVAWLRWIDTRATGSQAVYTRPATRCFYAHALAPVIVHLSALALGCDLALDRDLVLDRDLALDRDLDSYLALVRNDNGGLVIALVLQLLAGGSDCEITEKRDRILDLCVQQGRADLHAAIAALVMPDAKANHDEWQRYAIELEQFIETSGALTRYRQLQTEVRALGQEQRECWLQDNVEFYELISYSTATRLFFDCLQVAYAPDRRAFEERIFLPPS